MLKKILFTAGLLGVGLCLFLRFHTPSLPEKHGQVDLKLFLGELENQPLIVAFGGSEGGNVLASDQLKEQRELFLQRGYAFLAVGYFGTENTPASLDRISLNAIHDSIIRISNHSKIDKTKIALYGGSRGGELVLNLASRYTDFGAVIALVPSHVSLPSRFGWNQTSSWTFQEAEVPYLSSTSASFQGMDNNFFRAFSTMLEDEPAVTRSAIPVERINGPILLLSAKNDEVWPSALMCNQMMKRLDSTHFKYHYEHVSIEGSHAAPAKDSILVLDFLEKHFRNSRL